VAPIIRNIAILPYGKSDGSDASVISDYFVLLTQRHQRSSNLFQGAGHPAAHSTLSSVSAQSANHPEIFTIPHRKIITKHLTEGDMVPALQSELLPVEFPMQNLFQHLWSLIPLFLFSVHCVLHEKEKPAR
jgi:hypothetical protein